MDNNTASTSYFAAVARTYDRLQPIVAGPSYGEALEAIPRLIPHDPDDQFEFVELGCGTAEPSFRVLRLFPRARVTCIDSEPAMLQVARTKLKSMASRVEIRTADLVDCGIPPCDIVLSTKAFHHIAPADLPGLLRRIAAALRPSGCFILFDHMTVGPPLGAKAREQSRRLYRRHVADAIAAGQATENEIEERWALKKRIKAAGQDAEHWHSADNMLRLMEKVGFAEMAIVWRVLDDTILMGYTPDPEKTNAEQPHAADADKPRR